MTSRSAAPAALVHIQDGGGLQISNTVVSGNTVLVDDPVDQPSGFDAGMIVGASTLADWITQGFDEYMDPGLYYSAPSSKFNSVQVRDAMSVSVGQVLLFPIYRTIVGPGSNAQYDIIGWVGFYVTGFKATGNTGAVYGYFTRRVSGGIQVSPGSTIPDNGVRAVQLVN